MPKKYTTGVTVESRRDSSNDGSVCVVCYRKTEIFSIGECDHPVCYECSTRMRVLCRRTECPICRNDMAMVVFTHCIQLFANIQHKNMKYERRYSIYFADDEIMKAYDALLQHTCSECDGQKEFKTFNHLKDHMRKLHEKHYCDLCIDNLMIFTRERRCYNRSLLAQHRRIGDTDDKSHRGHPLCEFCDSRFMDNDELFRHLRRDHFFCHFCDADGNHQYYDDYEALREHFRTSHFLCEEGDCLYEKFTSAFRTKIDLQVHITQTHGQSMSKSEARQARTVDIAFTVNHSRQGHFSERGRGGRKGEGRGRRPLQDLEQQAAAAAAIPPEILHQRRAIDINCVQDFPSLNGVGGSVGESESGSNTNSIAHKLAQQNRFTIRTSRGNPLSEEDFPSLGSTTSVSVSSTPSTSNNPSNSTIPSTSLHFSVNTKKNNPFTVPQTNSGPNVSIQYNCAKPAFTPHSDLNTFTGAGKPKPRIGNISHSGNITVKSTPGFGSKPKSSVNEEDFPMLKSSSKAAQNIVLPANTSWGLNHNNTSSVVASKGPKKAIIKNPDLNTSTSNSDINNLSKDRSYQFESGDFPSLAPSSDNLQQKLNYSGRSSLTIPMKKALETKVLENDENFGGKGKKNKKGVVNKGSPLESNRNAQNVSAPSKPVKKKIILTNLFENYNPDEPFEDFSKGKEGEYEAVAPVMSSNIKFISSNNHSNEMNTKKSELQIGTLKAPEFNADDFPSLGFSGISSGKGSKKEGKMTQGRFENKSNQPTWNQIIKPSKKRPSVPPGFSKKSQAAMPPNFAKASMTFTSSLGQKFAISPTSEIPPEDSPVSIKLSHALKEKTKDSENKFLYPPNFEQRNNALIDAIHAGCDGNIEKFNKFKNLAAVFRSGQVKGQQYYERCKQIMGKKVFLSILPELLALLPDIEKQQGVFEAYRNVDGGQGCETCFAICAFCQQVLISDDFSDHMTKHDEFPSLGAAPASYQKRK